jgi:hypothetical protein
MADNDKKASMGITIFVFLLAIILLVLSIYQQNKSNKQKDELSKEITDKVTQNVTDVIKDKVNQPLPAELADYQSLTGLKKLPLVENFNSWTPDKKLEDDKIRKVIVLDNGKLAKGYIYIRASLSNKALSQWESIYIKMNNLGGHLFRPQSLEVPKTEKTELLYALNDVPYLPNAPYSEQLRPSRANWFGLFEDKKKVEVLTFISSLRQAKIEEISLYYGCVDDNECALSLSNQ